MLSKNSIQVSKDKLEKVRKTEILMFNRKKTNWVVFKNITKNLSRISRFGSIFITKFINVVNKTIICNQFSLLKK